MNNLWAPWRIGYVTLKKVKGCAFCKAYREKKDRKNFIVCRSKSCFVLLNIFPYNNGHLMVIPNKHISSIQKLKDKELLDLNKTVIKMVSFLKKILNPHGFNIGINVGQVAGAGIKDHFHIHVVPRWRGDTNFMPICADTKIIPQSMSELYRKIRECLRKKR